MVAIQEHWENASRVSQQAGKGRLSQLLDIVRLRLGPTKLGADEYYFYQLFEDCTFAEKLEFVGWRVSKDIDRALNQDDWRVYANDKVKFDIAMSEVQLRVPRMLAIYKPDADPISGVHPLASEEDTYQFLTNQDIYPVFCKPVHGTFGRGGFSILSVDESAGIANLGDGSSRKLTSVYEQFTAKWAEGYLVQKLLTPHSEVQAMLGDRLSSLRIVVVIDDNEPRLHRTVWKIPVGNNMSDNFTHGERGNLLANVESSTGNVTNIVSMRGGEFQQGVKHPDTGFDFVNAKVPLWSEIVEYCMRAAKLFPGLKLQHWDIAICPEGPVALEVNVEGGVDVHQLAGRRGFFDEDLKRILLESQ